MLYFFFSVLFLAYFLPSNLIWINLRILMQRHLLVWLFSQGCYVTLWNYLWAKPGFAYCFLVLWLGSSLAGSWERCGWLPSADITGNRVKNETRSGIHMQSISSCIAFSGWWNTYGYSYQEQQLQGWRQTLENLSAWVNRTLLLPRVRQMEGKLLCWILLLFN